MNLQQLRYVVATADAKTMTAAALALHVAQPALSRAVRALEQEIGVTIFARHGRGLRLTDEGREVVSLAERIVADVDRLAQLKHPVGLAVCATIGQARELVSPALAQQARQDGDCAVLDVVETLDAVFDAVRKGRAHLGVTELPAPPDLQSLSLGWQEFVLVYPGNWDLPDPLPLPDLAELPLLVPAAGDWRRERMETGLRASGVEIKVAAETSDRDMLLMLMHEGAGATFSYGRQAAGACAAGAGMVRLDPPAIREVGVVYSTEPSGAAADFVELLHAEAAQFLLPPGEARLAGAGRVAGPVVFCATT